MWYSFNLGNSFSFNTVEILHGRKEYISELAHFASTRYFHVHTVLNLIPSSLEKYVTRLFVVDKLIRLKATGSPKELSRKLNISESTVYRIMRILKENMQRSVEFDKHSNSYVYRNPEGTLNFERILLASEK